MTGEGGTETGEPKAGRSLARGMTGSQILRHYAPVLIGLVVFAVVATVTPTRVQTARASASTTPSSVPAINYPAGDAPGDPGTSAGGVVCGGSARQVTWSDYAPLCQPAFPAGAANGGSTSVGVTGDTITLSFRFAATPAEVSLAESLAPGAIGNEAEAIESMNDYIKVFNQAYDLYGRHVVLKIYQGTGDVLLETGGQDQPQAEADAATAKSLAVFADVSTLFNTTLYDNALANEGIVSVGGLFQSAPAMKALAPYEFSPGPDCQQASLSSSAVIGQALAHLPAIYAGDATTRTKTRVFGMLIPDTPTYTECSNTTVSILASKYHVKLAGIVRYGLSSLSGTSEAANAIAQLKTEGVTTVLCACDPLYPIYFTKAADSQDYHPEWQSLGFGDAFSRLPSQDQWAHAISGAEATLPQDQQEAYKVFRMVDSNPVPPTYASVYEPLLLFFDALQAAGPDLTPQHFAEGFDSLPTSLPGGQFGIWQFAPGTVSPSQSFQMLQWNPTAVSPQDGIKGTWQVCNAGRVFSYSDPTAGLPSGKQLQCPIKF